MNPTLGLSLPAVRAGRERIARPSEAAALLEALCPKDRPPWATALYAGLRRGELQALRWFDLDLEGGVIRVERSWDTKVGPIEPKSRAGRRRVPLGRKLRLLLIEHRLQGGPAAEGDLVFGSGERRPLAPRQLADRAKAAWKEANLEPIGLHECRHTYAAFMLRHESWSRPAGASPARVSAPAPGSRPQPAVERRRAERGVKSLFGGSERAGCDCSLVRETTREQSRSCHGEGHVRRPRRGSVAGSRRGMGSCTRAKAWSGTWETRLSSLVSKDRPHKPKAKGDGGQRESEGAVVVPIGAQNNVPGAKGPRFDRASGEGKRQA